MNLTKDPTVEQLAGLYACADDNLTHHKVWVDWEGMVHLETIEDFDRHFHKPGDPDITSVEFGSREETRQWLQDGEVVRTEKRIVPLDEMLKPDEHPVVKFHFETYIRGNGYVGLKASRDRKYMQKELDNLLVCWKKGVTGYLDWIPPE
jgi:hypothetical protein